MKATIWTMPLCGECERVKARLAARGCEIEERALTELISALGERTREKLEALAQFCAQNNTAPVVRLDGEFMSPAEALAAAED